MKRLVNRKFSMQELTAAQARGRLNPSMHRIGSGMVWRHMQFTPPPVDARMPVAETDTRVVQDKKEMFKLLQTAMVEPYATTMLWTHEMVKDWTNSGLANQMNRMRRNNVRFNIL